MTDQELLKRSAANDHQAFAELVRRYQDKVAGTVNGMLGKSVEADDVAQEVFIRFYQALPRFRGEAAVGTYLTRIAINLSLNALKRRKRRRFLFATADESAVAIAETATSATEQKEIVSRALQSLDPKMRAVAVLRLVDGYSTEETAAILGIPRGTVLSRLSAARQKLKEFLTPFFEEER